MFSLGYTELPALSEGNSCRRRACIVQQVPRMGGSTVAEVDEAEVRRAAHEATSSRSVRFQILLLLTFYMSAPIIPIDRRYEGSLNSEPTTLLQGTLDLLILKSLVAGEKHGLGISRRIQQISGGTFIVKPGSLFPALHRMEEEGWISAFWGESENNRRAKYYRLTKTGQKQLEVEKKRWGRISLAIAQALEAS